jgi:hypothetical protein
VADPTPMVFDTGPGRKRVTTHHVAIGQGLLRMIEDIHREIDRG